MTKLVKIYALCMAVLLAGSASAQTYDIVERRNFWNAGTNVTGLMTDSVTISYAEAYGTNMRGGFRESYRSDRMWSAGVLAKTIVHHHKYSMTGAFGFDNTSGRDMCGSMFIRPGAYPVDVLEFTPGRKDLQTYSFMGGIAGNIAPRWRIGGKIDFTAANYSKRKDIRHTNYLLDLKVAPGVMYHKDGLAVGMSYIFIRNTETIKAEKIGTKDAGSDYMAFLDKGLMYGAYENWDGSGIHLKELGAGFPVSEVTHGAAVQAQLGGLYAEVEYRYSIGEAGENDVIWFRFPKHSMGYRVAYRFGGGRTFNYIRLDVDWSRQENNELNLLSVTSNGITTTYGYKPNRIFRHDAVTVNPEYELVGPRAEFRLGVNISSEKRLATQMYPYVISQTMVCQRVYVSGVFHRGEFDVKYGAAFSSGNFTDKKRKDATEIEPGDPPHHLEEYHNLDNEYRTAPHMTFGLGLRYNFPAGMYAEVGVVYQRGLNLSYIDGAHRLNETIKIGYTF